MIELLIVVAIIGILAAIAIPSLLESQRRTKYAKAGTDAKTATSQSIIYSGEKGTYPPTLTALRSGGYANVSDLDPWGVGYELAPLLTSAKIPAVSDDIYIYSKGASKTGAYPAPFVADTGLGGSVGYSSVYGVWTGR